jgi:hypothetical protein
MPHEMIHRKHLEGERRKPQIPRERHTRRVARWAGAVGSGILARLLRRLNLRYPTLFVLFALLTVLDLIVPDPLPFVDELGLVLLTLLLGVWRDRRPPTATRR